MSAFRASASLFIYIHRGNDAFASRRDMTCSYIYESSDGIYRLYVEAIDRRVDTLASRVLRGRFITNR